jgi:hypothetical protein
MSCERSGPIPDSAVALRAAREVGAVRIAREVEHVPDGRHIGRNVGILGLNDGVGQVVSASVGQRIQTPLPLDELQDRDVVGVGADDPPPFEKFETTMKGYPSS